MKGVKIRKVRLADADGDVIIYHIVRSGKVKKLPDAKGVLRTLFYRHADLYRLCGIDSFDANALGWRPGDCDFDPSNPGFARFLRSRGKLRQEVLEEMSVDTFIDTFIVTGG